MPAAYVRALRDLREGENGLGQESSVRRHLKAMERAGLVSFVSGSWYRTAEGRAAIAETHS